MGDAAPVLDPGAVLMVSVGVAESVGIESIDCPDDGGGVVDGDEPVAGEIEPLAPHAVSPSPSPAPATPSAKRANPLAGLR